VLEVPLLEFHSPGARLVEAQLARLSLNGLALVYGVALEQAAGEGQILGGDLLAAQR